MPGISVQQVQAEVHSLWQALTSRDGDMLPGMYFPNAIVFGAVSHQSEAARLMLTRKRRQSAISQWLALPSDIPPKKRPRRSTSWGQSGFFLPKTMLSIRSLPSLLEKMGDTVVQAATGKDALEKWEQNQFDLVFMDVHMPEMNGFEATHEIRSREALTGAPVPIVAMTANTMSGDRERCLKSGMDDYIGKPITSRELLRVVAKFG